ncbi:YheC/YheD family protein [Gorillibacterium massiliense]|uniref:YheC/YheD family endospore coat-associated protein n=1 Tax=Gorillibacterium massiliense TaxID=1280390 RepID=UPI0006947A7E|nr:YheC/YheD family protein [Gorillibacterium massiliense]
MNSPLLGVMTLYLKGKKIDSEELPFFRSLIQHGNRIGLTAFVFTPEDADAHGKRINGLFYDGSSGKWLRKWTRLPDLVYDRCRGIRSPRFNQMRRFRSSHSRLLYLNHPIANKWGVHQLLQENKTTAGNLPETKRYSGAANLAAFLGKHRLVFLKPRDGSGGLGIASIERAEDGLYFLKGRDPHRRIIPAKRLKAGDIPGRLASWGLGPRYIMQQGIPIKLSDNRVHDFRLLLQKNGKGRWELTGIAGRVGGTGSVTSNLHGGGEAIGFEHLLARRQMHVDKITAVHNEMTQLSLAIAKVLERRFGRLCELALDLAVDPNGKVWLLEVNPKPSRDVFRRIGDKEAYRQAVESPVDYALWLYHNKGKHNATED